jgi:hypothetical protein
MPRKELGTRAEAREKEIIRCLKMNPTYIFMMDSDQTMPNQSISGLIGACADIAVIDCSPHDSEASNIYYNPDGTIAHCTISCCLIRAEIFKKLEKPWFSSKYDFVKSGVKNGKIVYNRLDKSVDNNWGEDIYFVRKVIEAGFTIKAVDRLKCCHFKIGDI